MEMAGVGTLTFDETLGWYFSAEVSASALGGAPGQIVVSEDYAVDEDRDAVDAAVRAFLSSDDTALRAASDDVFAYYLDTVRESRQQGWEIELPEIEAPAAVWDHVSFGREFHVDRDGGRDGQVYISVECACGWELEHGLQLVFLGGRTVTKVGPYDGHLTNAAAHGREDLTGAVYVSPFGH